MKLVFEALVVRGQLDTEKVSILDTFTSCQA